MERNTGLIFKFCEELETHIAKTNTFFDENLLQIIKNTFGFETVTVSMYKDYHFIDSFSDSTTASRGILDLERYNKARKVYDNDIFSQYISRNFFQFLMPKSNRVVQSSKLTLNIHKEHNKLFDTFKLVDCATVPINEQFRMSIMQPYGSKPLSDNDIEIFSNLAYILRLRYDNFKATEEKNAMANVQNVAMNDINIGVAILDKEKQIKHCNTAFLELTNVIFNTTFGLAFLSNLIDELQSTKKQCKMIGNYQVKMSSLKTKYSSVEQFEYYLITIVKSDNKLLPMHSEYSELFDSITAREREILELFCISCYTYQQIASELFISEETVKSHLKNIYRKVKCSNQRELVSKFIYSILGC